MTTPTEEELMNIALKVRKNLEEAVKPENTVMREAHNLHLCDDKCKICEANEGMIELANALKMGTSKENDWKRPGYKREH